MDNIRKYEYMKEPVDPMERTRNYRQSDMDALIKHFQLRVEIEEVSHGRSNQHQNRTHAASPSR